MVTLAPSSPSASSTSQSPSFHRRRKSSARRVERCCCTTLAYFPLLFVYGLSTWAAWVEVNVSFLARQDVVACVKAGIGVALWALANWSYTVAVFTSAGSPVDGREDWSLEGRWRSKTKGWGGARKKAAGGYEGLPTSEGGGGVVEDEGAAQDSTRENAMTMTSVTAKSTGQRRYCKKCACIKPDRTHHCSSCERCVLKMDHHCPWLATCVGLHNYKPFVLFLVYTSLFCWVCFLVSASWVWAAILDDERMQEGMVIVNTIMLAVLGGIIGLVLSGFTGWHLYLAVTGQTTIESLEQTRYLTPLRKSMEHQLHSQRNFLGSSADDREGGGNVLLDEERAGGQEQSLLDQLKETHANALPGVLRPEEGEDNLHTQPTSPLPQPQHLSTRHTITPFPTTSSSSPAQSQLKHTYASLEAAREHDRYNAYLDETDSEQLPNAFDLGWRRNLLHVFGTRPAFWGLPVCNTSGDGWVWEVSPKWREASEAVVRRRVGREEQQQQYQYQHQQGFDQQQGFGPPQHQRREYKWAAGQGFVNPGSYNGGGGAGGQMQMQTLPLDRRKQPPHQNGGGGEDDVDAYDTSSDEDVHRRTRPTVGTANWNDVPEEFLVSRGVNGNGNRSRSRGRRKGD